jgi:hypothetical protein
LAGFAGRFAAKAGSHHAEHTSTRAKMSWQACNWCSAPGHRPEAADNITRSDQLALWESGSKRLFVAAQVRANAKRLEHSSSRLAVVRAKNPPETTSWLRMVHLLLSMLVRID